MLVLIVVIVVGLIWLLIIKVLILCFNSFLICVILFVIIVIFFVLIYWINLKVEEFVFRNIYLWFWILYVVCLVIFCFLCKFWVFFLDNLGFLIWFWWIVVLLCICCNLFIFCNLDKFFCIVDVLYFVLLIKFWSVKKFFLVNFCKIKFCCFFDIIVIFFLIYLYCNGYVYIF